jgi:hypothetical protein
MVQQKPKNSGIMPAQKAPRDTPAGKANAETGFKMLSLVNVAIGAILGVVLVESPIFHINQFSDLFTAFFFITLVIFQATNIQASIIAFSRRRYNFFAWSIVFYLGAEAAVFLSYTFDPSLLPAGQQGVVFRFTGFGYVWLFILMTLMWMLSNVAAAAWDEFGPV